MPCPTVTPTGKPADVLPPKVHVPFAQLPLPVRNLNGAKLSVVNAPDLAVAATAVMSNTMVADKGVPESRHGIKPRALKSWTSH